MNSSDSGWVGLDWPYRDTVPLSPVLSAFQRSTTRRSRLSGVPMGPKLEKGMAPWLCVGGEDGRLLGLEEWGDWLAGVEWSANQNTADIRAVFPWTWTHFLYLSTGVTYLSWQGGRGTRESPRTGSRGTAPGASWEHRAWSWAAGSSRRPDWRCCSGCTPEHTDSSYRPVWQFLQ